MNQHDTAALRAALDEAGWQTSSDGEPDVIVVNTCTVTARADQEARQLVRRLARERPGARIVVAGCYAQRAPVEVAALPGVSTVVGGTAPERLLAVLGAAPSAAASDGAKPDIRADSVAETRARRPIDAAAPRSFGRTRALLKVQDGCDSFCAYCVVPYVRGRSRSLAPEAALEQARRLLDAGFRELVLTGADLGAYGRDLGAPALLPELVERILGLGSAHRVRLSSIEPHKLHPALVAMIGAEPRLCRHLHLPLQSGSASTLRAMRRPYAPEEYADLVRRLAARGPVAIGADVIVGHPGEGEAEFEETLRFVESVPLTYLHVFRYSPRPGTRAALDPGRAGTAAARSRAGRLRALGEAKRAAFHASLVDRVLPGIPETARPDGSCSAMTDVYAPVRLARRPDARGIVPVRIESIEGAELVGVVPDTLP